MSLEYYALTFEMGKHDHEIWLALLGEWPFESFHDEENQIIGYIQDHDITGSMMESIGNHQGYLYLDYTLTKVPDKNWNAVWESSFNPVEVDDYCYIRAEFHPAIEKPFEHILTISPKMAFGTGHHATTFMMIKAMSKINFKGQRVFDFGCGTGILAVLAAKEGAKKVIGVDIQTEAIENSYEHAGMNNVTGLCEFYLGGLEEAGKEPYEVILANINRNVIIDSLPELVKLLKPNGSLLISGIMFDDEKIIEQELNRLNIQVLYSNQKDQWIQLTTVNGKN